MRTGLVLNLLGSSVLMCGGAWAQGESSAQGPSDAAKAPGPVAAPAAATAGQGAAAQAAPSPPVAGDGGGSAPHYASLDLEELLSVRVSSTGFFDSESRKTTGQARIYDAELFKLYSVRSIAELLQAHQPGVLIGEHERTSTLIGVRGVLIDNNAKTLVMHDGVNMNMRSHFARAGSDLAVPLIGDIERVEVILGPGAIVHGTGAVNGFINIIRPTGISRPGAWGKASYASGDTRTLEVSYGGLLSEKRNIDYFLYFGYADNEGEEPPAPPRDPKAAYGDEFAGVRTSPYLRYTRVDSLGEPNYKGFARARYGSEKSPVGVDLRVEYSQTSRMANSPNADQSIDRLLASDSGHRNDGHLRVRSFAVTPEIHVNVREGHAIELTPSFVAFESVTVPADWVVKEAEKVPGVAAGEGAIASQGKGEEHYDLRAVYKTTVVPNSQIALGGWVSEKRFGDDRSIWGRGNWKGFESPHKFSWTELAVFGEDTVSFRDFTVSAGLRYDHTDFGTMQVTEDLTRKLAPIGNASYRTAIAYAISEGQNVKVSYQKGFRFPDAAYYLWIEKFNAAFADAPIAPLPALKPEQSHLVELNYFLSLIGKRLAVDLTLFYERYRDTLGWVWWSDVRPDDFAKYVSNSPKHPGGGGWWGSFSNITSDVSAVGGELGLLGDLGEGFSADVWYNLSKPFGPEDPTSILTTWDGKAWANYPIHLLKGHLSYRSGRFTAAAVATFRTGINSHGTKAEPVSDSDALPERFRLYARPAFDLDASISFKPVDHVWVSVFGKNLTFNKVPPPGGFQGQPVLTTGRPYLGASVEVDY